MTYFQVHLQPNGFVSRQISTKKVNVNGEEGKCAAWECGTIAQKPSTILNRCEYVLASVLT